MNDAIDAGYELSGQARMNRVDFSEALVAGEMAEDGTTLEGIAKKLFPRDFRPDKDGSDKIESATKKAGSRVKTYRELIAGGYKKLTLP